MELPDVTNWTHQLDASSAECLLFVLKEGLLSAVAHDLKLRVDEFEVAIDEPTKSVAAIFNAESLRVINAMKDGKDDPGALSEDNKKQIELNIRLDVSDASGIEDWRFTIRDRNGALFNSFSGEGMPAQQIIWNGRSSSGELVISAEDYPYRFEISDSLGNSTSKSIVLRNASMSLPL